MRPPAASPAAPADIQLDPADARRLRHLRRRGVDAPQTIANCEAYWSRSLAVEYLDLLDDVAADAPKIAAAMSEGAETLIDRALYAREDPWRSEAEYRTYSAYGHAVRASCCRSAGVLDEADVAIGRAMEMASLPGVALWAQGEVLRRRAAILAHVAGPEAALSIAQESLEFYRGENFPEGLADALALVGGLSFAAGAASEACHYFVSAMQVANGKSSRMARTRCACVINLGHALSQCGDIGQLKQAAVALRAELKGTRLREHRGRLLWAIGRIELRMGASRSAARRFRAAVKQLAGGSDPTLFELAADCISAAEGFSPSDLAEVLTTLESSAVGQTLPEAVEAWSSFVEAHRPRLSVVTRSE